MVGNCTGCIGSTVLDSTVYWNVIDSIDGMLFGRWEPIECH